MNKNVVLSDLSRICFVDIETVGQKIDIENNPILREFIKKKYKLETESEVTNESVLLQGGLYPETGKIICISVGVFNGENFRVKSFYGDEEVDLLKDFVNMLETNNFSLKYTLCGHNIEGFDIPFIAKRCILNGIKIPFVLNIMTKKEWDYNFIDTMKLWAFGDTYNNRISLKVACEIFGIPTSKSDIDGSQVSQVYYQSLFTQSIAKPSAKDKQAHEEDLNRIAKYCESDVVATARLFQKITQNGYLKDENILIR